MIVDVTRSTGSSQREAGLKHALMRPALLRILVALGALGGIAGLVLAVNPGAVGHALQGFDVRALVPAVLLVLAFHLLQGLRWHLLLRQSGVRIRHLDSQLINLAGQAATAVLPLGDLTRALLASRVARVRFGAVAATVTVQELSFMLLVVAAAAPGLGRLPGGAIWMLVLLSAIAGIVVILTVDRVFARVRRLVGATPVLQRFTTEIETLQREARRLLGNRAVLAGAALDLGRVVVCTVAMLVILRGMHVMALDWADAALVVSVSFAGGALSFLPGGIGANEASVVGVLVVLGVNPGVAAAAAIVQRLSLTIVPTTAGSLSYLVLRRRRAAVAAHVSGDSASPRGLQGRRVAAAAFAATVLP